MLWKNHESVCHSKSPRSPSRKFARGPRWRFRDWSRDSSPRIDWSSQEHFERLLHEDQAVFREGSSIGVANERSLGSRRDWAVGTRSRHSCYCSGQTVSCDGAVEASFYKECRVGPCCCCCVSVLTKRQACQQYCVSKKAPKSRAVKLAKVHSKESSNWAFESWYRPSINTSDNPVGIYESRILYGSRTNPFSGLVCVLRGVSGLRLCLLTVLIREEDDVWI